MADAIRIVRLEHATGLSIPVRMTPGSSGCDICAAVSEDIIIMPGERVLVPTGFCFEIPIGYEIQIRPRSGLAIKHGITVLNAPGTIDADYRGEVKIILINSGSADFKICRGDRIAQLVIAQVAHNTIFIEADEMESTSRGSGGFGHTGM
ncbi:MAG: dUTP diphosphatase [Chitinispirillaceae bacterium]|nr:dUTP diphosphatase [Chitinispirillaceae bacterium]